VVAEERGGDWPSEQTQLRDDDHVLALFPAHRRRDLVPIERRALGLVDVLAPAVMVLELVDRQVDRLEPERHCRSPFTIELAGHDARPRRGCKRAVEHGFSCRWTIFVRGRQRR